MFFSLFRVAEYSMSEEAIGEVFGPVILRPSHENLTYVTVATLSISPNAVTFVLN